MKNERTEMNASMDDITVSIIIPCFNQGIYVSEALESVFAQSYGCFEIIIVDDGSTDEETTSILAALDLPKTRIIHTTNHGVSHARNVGIREATGEYILPLDADDRIGKEYVRKALEGLKTQADVGFVYCLAEMFGSRRGKFLLNKATITDMLIDSRVFCTAMFRKSDWLATGGYNSNMVYGWEDWDFWLSLIEMGKLPYCIQEVLFYYRVKEQSRTRAMTLEHKLAMHKQLVDNHCELYYRNLPNILEEYYRHKNSWYGKLTEFARKIMFSLKHLGK